MINYDQVLSKQKKLKFDILYQRNKLFNTYPYINITEILESRNSFIWFNYSFKKWSTTSEERWVVINTDDKRKVEQIIQRKIKDKDSGEIIEKIYCFENLPIHFGLTVSDEQKMYGKDILPGSVCYKANNSITNSLEGYIVFQKPLNKNYLTYRKEGWNKIIFNYTPFYEKAVETTDDVFTSSGYFYFDIFYNPIYNYDQLINSDTLKIPYNKIKNLLLQPSPCYFKGMPLQEQIFYNNQIVFADLKKQREQMYKTNKQGERDDFIEYSCPISMVSVAGEKPILRLY